MADDQLDGSVFRRLYEGFTAAFENEDNDALARLYAPTAAMIGPGGNVLAGRDAILAFLQRAQRIQSVRFEATHTSPLGDGLVRQLGDLALTVRGQGRETRTVAGSFLVLWAKRDLDWQIDTCVWSRRPDPNARAAGRGMGGGAGGGAGRMGGRGMGGGGRGMGGGGGGRGIGGGGGGGGRLGGGPGGRGGRGADDVDGSSEAGEGGTMARRGSRSGRAPVRGPGRDGEQAFNPRNLHRDDAAPLIPRLE